MKPLFWYYLAMLVLFVALYASIGAHISLLRSCFVGVVVVLFQELRLMRPERKS